MLVGCIVVRWRRVLLADAIPASWIDGERAKIREREIAATLKNSVRVVTGAHLLWTKQRNASKLAGCAS